MKLADYDITSALEAWNRGEADAFEQLMPRVISDLRRTAQSYMRHENPAHTLQATALVNEVYMVMVGRRSVHWKNRAQFFGFAGKLMHRILVDHARRRRSQKRGGHLEIVPLTGPIDHADSRHQDLDTILDVHTALEELEKLDPVAMQIAELSYFAGMNQEEIQEALDLSRRQVQQNADMARRWLKLKLKSHRREE